MEQKFSRWVAYHPPLLMELGSRKYILIHSHESDSQVTESDSINFSSQT